MDTVVLLGTDAAGLATPNGLLRIGGVDKVQMMEALARSGIQLNPLAYELFEDFRFTLSPARMLVEIVCVTSADLGLTEGGMYHEIVASAKERGLVECPLELGPHLRLAYTAQPEGAVGQPVTKNKAPPGSITVASAPLDAEDSTPKGFYLRRIDGVLWLRAYRSWPGHVWSCDDSFVFQRDA